MGDIEKPDITVRLRAMARWNRPPGFPLQETDAWQGADEIERLRVALGRYADEKNWSSASELGNGGPIMGCRLGSETAKAALSAPNQIEQGEGRCQCPDPMIRCDNRGCNCTFCGLPKRLEQGEG